MNSTSTPSVCIVGAGSMGITVGYLLSQAGASINYLVRAHRKEQLAKPQLLYCYDDASLRTYDGYKLLTDPSELMGTSFDFVLITLDGAAFKSEDGQQLIDAIGSAFRGTSTAVILGSGGIAVRDWFLERSGLAQTQVNNGLLWALAHEGTAKLPVHPGAKADLLAQSDYAYRHLSPVSFSVDLSAPEIAHKFAALYNRNGISKCTFTPAGEFKVGFTYLTAIVTWELLDWQAAANIDPANEIWQLGMAAMREFQQLSVFGEAGRAASEQMTAEGVLGMFQQQERDALPLDLAAFNKYHHGGKVNKQDHAILREALRRGEEEQAEMAALRAMVALLPPEISKQN